MKFVYSLFFFAFVECTSEKTLSSLTPYVLYPCPCKIVLVECVNEPGIENSVVNALTEFPIRNIYIRGGGCCMHFEAILALRSKQLTQDIEERLRTTPGVLTVQIK